MRVWLRDLWWRLRSAVLPPDRRQGPVVRHLERPGGGENATPNVVVFRRRRREPARPPEWDEDPSA